jgi:hypothetical protein
MSYTLAGTTIKKPQSMTEENSTQVAQIRTLSGNINRDFFGSNKRVWTLDYSTIVKADYDIINTIYLAYLSTGSPVAFISTETNYPVSSVNVHVDLLSRGFSYKGGNYLSDFTLILTEA